MINFILGGENGYSFGIVISTWKVPPVSSGPFIVYIRGSQRVRKGRREWRFQLHLLQLNAWDSMGLVRYSLDLIYRYEYPKSIYKVRLYCVRQQYRLTSISLRSLPMAAIFLLDYFLLQCYLLLLQVVSLVRLLLLISNYTFLIVNK